MIQIPTFNSSASDFEQTINLEDQTLTLRIHWNGRSSHWYMDIQTQEGTDLLTGRKLVPVLPVAYSHRALCGFKGDFVLLPETDQSPEYPTFEGLGTDHNLYWLNPTELAEYEAALGIR